MINVEKLFKKQAEKFRQIQEIYRDSCKRQISKANEWEIDILHDEIHKHKEVLKQ